MITDAQVHIWNANTPQEPWDPKATDYKALFGKINTAGADCVYLGGIYDLNGGQVTRDQSRGVYGVGR